MVRLAHPGSIVEALVDTSHYKGNFPESCSLRAASLNGNDADAQALADDGSVEWHELLPRTPLQADTHQRFRADELGAIDEPVTHVRMDIFPDGGIARLRLYGIPDPASRAGWEQGEQLTQAATAAAAGEAAPESAREPEAAANAASEPSEAAADA